MHNELRLASVVGLLLSVSGFAADEPTKVVMLGTGSPPPTPAWSGPATAIEAGGRAYLVDFGPGVIRRAAAAAEKGITAKTLTDMAPDEWQRMLCVETVNAARGAVHLAPETSHKMKASIRLA